jgi:uncharacterized protein DUF6983
MLLIPTDPDSPLYEERVTLERQEYLLRFDYNGREDRWYLDVALIDGTLLVRGWKLVTGVMLGNRVADRRMPGGRFVVHTQDADDSAPGFGELGEGRRCQLYYLSRAELGLGGLAAESVNPGPEPELV